MLSNIGQDRWKTIHIIFLLVFLIFLTVFSISDHHVRMRMQHDVFDTFNRLSPRPAGDSVIIVDIDELALETYGQWPWPRNIMADLVNNLTMMEAKVIVMDGVMAEPDRTSPKYFLENLPKDDISRNFFDTELNTRSSVDPDDMNNMFDHDAMFAASIKESGRFITAFSWGRTDRSRIKPFSRNKIQFDSDTTKQSFINFAPRFEAATDNLPLFTKSSADNGSFMASVDPDGVLRRAGMIFSDGEATYPSLSLAALRVSELGRKGVARIVELPQEKRKEIDTAYRITFGKRAIPVESDGMIFLYFRHFCNEYEVKSGHFGCERQDYVSARKILDTQYHEEAKPLIKDKIVLIGTSAEGLKDLRSTAIEPFRPGVEIHANAIEQVLQEKYLLRPEIARAAEMVYILVAGLFFILFAPFVGVMVSTSLCVGLVMISFLGAYWKYTQAGLLLDPVYPSFSVITIFIVSTLLSYAREESLRRQIRQAFGMYVAPDVMRDLEKNPGNLRLGGETRTITVMFTDIRKFTRISEGLSPEQLINLMNEFLTSMTDIVLAERGTVDKYIGDAMMTFWNAPRDVPDHPACACRAALRMQKALEPVNKRIEQEAKAQDRPAVILQTGIGIAAGACAVGNMGSKQRFAYSALGDPVNLASRLEGLTKFYGVSIIISEEVRNDVPTFAALELDLIRVVGKSHAVRIFALLGDPDYASHGDFGKWSIEHETLIDKYRARDFEGALAALALCENISAPLGCPLDEYYDLLRARIEDLKTTDLPSDWDAVFEAKEK
ncbi:MAG: adenylate/guanylate cyclase domain-containing protein [Alphaproteobacteria bacterium]|nr:adenylate/guanylate cyclase domain-containing protein [Alphaproteobacteria bacterium]MCB9974253.1 adenylate/guanylate cyclase domain-containing protein [Rhodospirillales bacterium]